MNPVHQSHRMQHSRDMSSHSSQPSGITQQSFETSIASQTPTPATERPLTYIKELVAENPDAKKLLPRDMQHLVDLPIHRIPSYSFAYWFYKSPDASADIPDAYIHNTTNFAQQNPDFTTQIITNDPARMQQQLSPATDQSLHITAADYDFGTEFPLLGKLAQAAVSHAPEMTKDLLALKDLRKEGGLLSDPDTAWEEELPNPFVIDGPIAAHRKTENSVIAYAGKSENSDILGDVLRHAEAKIPSLFQETEKFTLKEPMTRSSIVNQLYYNFYEKIMQENKTPSLEMYTDYKTPFSSYVQKEKLIYALNSNADES